MLCPVCKAELVVTGQDRLETLSEHVCNPNGIVSMKNKYECSDPNCLTTEKIYWNSGGESYGEVFDQDIPFIDGNDSPFGSIQRQLNIEINKKDENHPLFGIKTRWGHIEVVYSYKSNKDGDILSRKHKYQIWKKDKDGIGYTSYLPGISMLLFVLSDFFRKKKYGALKKRDLYPMWTGDRRWWSLVGHWLIRLYLKVFCRDLYKRLQGTS